MSDTQSPLARLVLFVVCLAIAGSIVAGVHYYAVDLPAQNIIHPPANSVCNYHQKPGCSQIANTICRPLGLFSNEEYFQCLGDYGCC